MSSSLSLSFVSLFFFFSLSFSFSFFSFFFFSLGGFFFFSFGFLFFAFFNHGSKQDATLVKKFSSPFGGGERAFKLKSGFEQKNHICCFSPSSLSDPLPKGLKLSSWSSEDSSSDSERLSSLADDEEESSDDDFFLSSSSLSLSLLESLDQSSSLSRRALLAWPNLTARMRHKDNQRFPNYEELWHCFWTVNEEANLLFQPTFLLSFAASFWRRRDWAIVPQTTREPIWRFLSVWCRKMLVHECLENTSAKAKSGHYLCWFATG